MKRLIFILVLISNFPIFTETLIEIQNFTPEYNILSKQERTDLIFIFYDGLSNETPLLVLNASNYSTETINDFDVSNIIDFVYYPFIYGNYIYIEDENKGWYKLEYYPENRKLQRRFIWFPPGGRVRLPFQKYSIFNDKYVIKYDYINGNRGFSIVEETEDYTIWEKEFPVSDLSYGNVYWLGDYFLMQTNTHIVASSDNEYNSENPSRVINYKENIEIDFTSELVIGYGRGFIITTSAELYGVNIYNLKNELLFQEKDVDLLSPTKCKYNNEGGSISFAYFENPNLFISLVLPGGICGYGETYMVLNLEKNQIITPATNQSNLLGIFK